MATSSIICGRHVAVCMPKSGLVAITIEGASPSEVATGQIAVGEEVIDVGEYYGSENVKQATLIRYIQLKHSTVRASQHWTPSGLKNTLEGFASRYKALQQRLQGTIPAGKLELCFLTNRPISASFIEAVDDAAKDNPPRHPGDLAKLETIVGLTGAALSDFCKLLRFEGNQEGYWDQRTILVQDVSGYLPDADVDAPTLLKELVTRKALSESGTNPTITKIDVLRALKTDASRLFPAPCRIELLPNAVPREQEADLIQDIIQANNRAIVVHAAGGIGKSIFATRIKLGLPEGSFAILYDCFGNGQYRSASGYRHRHKDALVEIANELAAEGFCHPLIPTPHAEPSDYIRAFLHRLRQTVKSLRSAHPDSLLCVAIDAADNAQIAAEEIGEGRSFVRDLVREQLPDGVRLVVLCRTHRQVFLDLPPNALPLELKAFITISISEAAAYFDAAVEVASKIGDENLDRWAAMLDLADRAARQDRPAPETAYRLSRCAELSYDYVDRDKHFAWNATVRSIAALCPASSLAILSRWRDRNFGWHVRLLPVAVEFLISRGSLDPKVALALVGFRAQWREACLLKPALSACASLAEKQANWDFLYRYMSLESHRAGTWREIKEALAAHGWHDLKSTL
jgi:hypothetical protein